MANGRKITCKGCGLYLGILRDARIRNGVTFLCKNCEVKRVASDLARKTAPRNPLDDFMDAMNRGGS